MIRSTIYVRRLRARSFCRWKPLDMKKMHLVTARLAEHAGVFSVATGHGYMKIDETSLAMSAGVSKPS